MAQMHTTPATPSMPPPRQHRDLVPLPHRHRLWQQRQLLLAYLRENDSFVRGSGTRSAALKAQPADPSSYLTIVRGHAFVAEERLTPIEQRSPGVLSTFRKSVTGTGRKKALDDEPVSPTTLSKTGSDIHTGEDISPFQLQSTRIQM